VEFLVQIQVTFPPGLASTDRQELMEREQARGWELKNEGVIRRMWRIPGRTANVGIWDAADATALHDGRLRESSTIQACRWKRVSIQRARARRRGRARGAVFGLVGGAEGLV